MTFSSAYTGEQVDQAIKVGLGLDLDTLAELQAYTGSSTIANVKGRTTDGDGYQGTFVYTTGDYSYQETNDTYNGIYVAKSGIATTTGVWIRQYTGIPKAKWFGITMDGSAEYDSGWVYTPGTDQGAKINNVTELFKALEFEYSCSSASSTAPIYWIETPIKLKSGLALIGADGVPSRGSGTHMAFNGAATENMIEVDTSVYEVSNYIIKNMRLDDDRTSPTGGYGIFANRAVNRQQITNCFIGEFPDGSIFVGADSNDRAGDNINIERTWVTVGSSSGYAIGIGNFNNICSLRDIYGTGDGIIVYRTNGNNVAGHVFMSNVKHEAGDSDADTITLGTSTYVTAIGIFRFADPGSTGVTINPVSSRGVYMNIANTKTDGTGSNTYNLEYSTGEQFFANNYIYKQTFAEDIYAQRALASSLDIPYAGMVGNYVFGDAPAAQVSFSSSDIAPVIVYRPNDESTNKAGMILGNRNKSAASIPALDIVSSTGARMFSFDWETSKLTLNEGGAGVTIRTGSGSPEGVVTAVVSSLYLRTDGGANTTLYVKESGSGNTGWAAI